ncbi:MAG TPA: glutathione S-transferase family protein [Rhodocyclaceae bacterium]|nr:glutathione S-transferase family protein [Rhodocyclaceae bacterium]
MALTLYVGNKNYSSWSMRPWVLLKEAGIEFTERMVRFDSFDAQSAFKRTVAAVNPVGKVPVLVDDEVAGGLVVWDTLAICEYVAEKFPEHQLWPRDRAARARARSVCAEMHAGFSALRTHFPMNIEASLPEVGQRVLHDQADVRQDVARFVEMWSGLLADHGGPLLFGRFSIADAYFAPVCMRFNTYGVPVPERIGEYIDALFGLPGVAQWVEAARAEGDFLSFEEPYRRER